MGDPDSPGVSEDGSVLQVYAFLVIASLFGIDLPPLGFLTVLPAMIVTGLMLGATTCRSTFHRPIRQLVRSLL